MATKKTAEKVPSALAKATEKKHITPELLWDVIKGVYGEGAERNAKLKAEGYNPGAVTVKLKQLQKLAEELKPIRGKAGEYFTCVFLLCDN